MSIISEPAIQMEKYARKSDKENCGGILNEMIKLLDEIGV